MSDDKFDEILSKLASLESGQKAGFAALQDRQAALEERQTALEERQKSDFGMIAGALDGLAEKIRSVDSSVAQVNLAVKENSQLVAQLRSEHGAYLRTIQREAETLDRRVALLEGGSSAPISS